MGQSLRTVVTSLLFLGVCFATAAPLAAQKPKPFLGTCGTPQNPCKPGIDFEANTSVAHSLPSETGSYSYTITVLNNGNADGDYVVLGCGVPQLTCTASPASFFLAQLDSVVDTIRYNTLGVGVFTQTVRYEATPHGLDTPIVNGTFTAKVDTVTGVPIAQYTYPLNDGVYNTTDTIRVTYDHPSGVDSTTFKLFIDGHDSTGSAHSHRTATTLWANLTLLGGAHTFKAYGCAKNVPARCDTSLTVFAAAVGQPTVWQLDDSLPINTEIAQGWVPGGIPLPATNLLGCPTALGYPAINLTDPASYLPQPNGSIFVAQIIWDDSIHIAANTLDYLATDSLNHVCSNTAIYPYLQDSMYAWNFWVHTDPHDTLWVYYPYGDRTAAAIAQTIGAPPQGGFNAMMKLLPGGTSGSSTTPGSGSGAGAMTLGGSSTKSKGPIPFLLNGGGIDTNSYNVTINGDTIIKNGKPWAGKGVIEQVLGQASSLYSMSTAHSDVNIYDPARPDTSHNGGWNEMIASIADTGGHRTSVRSRFVVVKSPNPIATLRPVALRNFNHSEQSDCAAFGAFQCGGTILAQAIPGFVTRDKDRSLHLVFRFYRKMFV